MCQQGGSWFQVVVLSSADISTRYKRQAPFMSFEKLDRFQGFLIRSLGSFLTPVIRNANSTTTIAATVAMTTSRATQIPFASVLCLHLLAACLHLLS